MAAPLPRALAAVTVLSRLLRCPSCACFLTQPHRVAACAHVVCEKCADLAKAEAKCPVQECALPTRPAEVQKHRDVSRLTEAVASLALFAQEETREECPVKVRVREDTKKQDTKKQDTKKQASEKETTAVRIRIREPAGTSIGKDVIENEREQKTENRAVQLRLRVRPPASTAKRKRPRGRPSPTSVILSLKGENQERPMPNKEIVEQSKFSPKDTDVLELCAFSERRPSKKPKTDSHTKPNLKQQKGKDNESTDGDGGSLDGRKELFTESDCHRPDLLPKPIVRAQFRGSGSRTHAEVAGRGNGFRLSKSDVSTPEAKISRSNTISTVPTILSSMTEQPRLFALQKDTQSGTKTLNIRSTERRKNVGRCVYDKENRNTEKRKGGSRNIDRQVTGKEKEKAHSLRTESPEIASVPPDEGISPLSFEKKWKQVASPPVQTHRRLSFTEHDADTLQKPASGRIDNETVGNFSVCLTGLSRGNHQLELAEEMIAALGGEIFEDFSSEEIPRCVVTIFDDCGNVKNRTMLVHEALVRRIPVVNIQWLVTSFRYGMWAQTSPFEMEVSLPADSKGVFKGILASFDHGFSREKASALVKKAGDDIRRVVKAGGAHVAETRDIAALLLRNDLFSLHIHVACDFGESSSGAGAEVCGEEMDLLRSSQNAVATRVVSMPWISDCIFSGVCPPPNNEKSESMSGFSEYTSSESQKTRPPSNSKSDREPISFEGVEQMDGAVLQ